MTIFDNILNVLLPDYPTPFVFEFADRVKSQHSVGFVLALYTFGLYPHVGQGGIETINHVQVANHSLVQQYMVIAQHNSEI